MNHRTSLAMAAAALALLGLAAIPAHAAVSAPVPPIHLTAPNTTNVSVNGLNRSGTIAVGEWFGRLDSVNHGAKWGISGRFTDLGAVPGEAGTWAMGVNDRGVVYGESVSGGLYGYRPHSMEWRTRAVRWDRTGHMAALGWLPGGTDAEPTGISADGTIVGRANDAPGASLNRAVLWGKDNRIMALPQRGYYTYPVAIADDHSVIGDSVSENNARTAVRWNSHHRLCVLRTPAGWSSLAEAANRYGVAVGTVTDTAGVAHPVRWDRAGQMTTLRVPRDVTSSAVLGIDAKGIAFGWIGHADGTLLAATWDRHGRITVIHVRGTVSTKPVAMNDHGVLAGWIWTPSRRYPAVWDGRGHVRELSTPYIASVEPAPTDITIVGIADNGVVAGQYRTDGPVNVLWRTTIR